MSQMVPEDLDALERERHELLERAVAVLEGPMVALGFVWLALLVIEFAHGQTPSLSRLGTLIWIVFLLDFGARFLIAPRKLPFVRANWLTMVSLAVPALRVLRVARAWRGISAVSRTPGTRLLRVLTSLNRGMRALGSVMGRRGFGYVVVLTLAVTVTGAAAMFAFERSVPGSKLTDFPSALWWTAMVMTTMGSEYWPQSGEGRILCLVLSLYAFAAFGYVTAALASYFVDRDAARPDAEVAGAGSIDALRAEIAQLRADLAHLQRGGGDRGVTADWP